MSIGELVQEYVTLLDREPLSLEVLHRLGAFVEWSETDGALDQVFQRRFRACYGRDATGEEMERYLPLVNCGMRLKDVLHA